MTVALVHYHLRRGGVTRVMEGQSKALHAAGIAHVLLSGTPYQGDLDLPVEIVPELQYEAAPGIADGPDLAARLRTAAARALGSAPDLWHLHNPSLGKNTRFPSFVAELASSGQPLVLQPHDFAEDGRPQNYRNLVAEEFLYPHGAQIRYAFINSRDRALLIAAGLPPGQTVLLPNPVIPPAPPTPSHSSGSPPAVLYPVRGIRRKNLGELCLLAALAPPDATFAQSLAPENPQWRPAYDRWVAAAARHDLPVRFGVVNHTPPAPGSEPTYENWLAHSSHIVTTSIAEGFGLSFLEPIAQRHPLLGRDLPEITADFKSDHLHLGDLYERLLVPADWIDRAALFTSLQHNLAGLYAAYQVPLPPALPGETLHALLHDGYLDFANLPEDLQGPLLTRALAAPREVLVDRTGGAAPAPAADWLAGALATTTPRSDPAALAPYSLDHYQQRLQSLYQDLANATPTPPAWLDNSAVLSQFLQPHRFHFLRT